MNMAVLKVAELRFLGIFTKLNFRFTEF